MNKDNLFVWFGPRGDRRYRVVSISIDLVPHLFYFVAEHKQVGCEPMPSNLSCRGIRFSPAWGAVIDLLMHSPDWDIVPDFEEPPVWDIKFWDLPKEEATTE